MTSEQPTENTRVEVGVDGCGCTITEEATPNGASVPDTERTEHRANCWAVPKPGEPGVALATNFDLFHILAGHQTTLATADGHTIAVRLFTADELLATVANLDRKAVAQGLHPGPGMTRAKAEELTTRLPN